MQVLQQPRRVVIAAVCFAGLAAAAAAIAGATHASAATKKVKIAFVSGGNNSIWFQPMGCGIVSEAHALGASVSITAPAESGSIPQTLQLITAAEALKPTAMILDPLDRTAFNPTLASVKASGIKVLFTDQSTSDPSVAVTGVTSNNVAAGGVAGKALVKDVGGSGPVLILSGFAAQNSLSDRVKGFDQAIGRNSGITSLGVQYDQQSPVTAQTIVSATLAAHPNLAGIFDTASTSVAGVVTALQQAGDIGKVKVIGFDSIPSEISEVKAGQIQGAIGQSPHEMGALAVKSLYQALAGKKVPRVQYVPTKLITKANVNSASTKAYIYSTKACSA